MESDSCRRRRRLEHCIDIYLREMECEDVEWSKQDRTTGFNCERQKFLDKCLGNILSYGGRLI
jgi:hypothetical protein